MYQVLKDKFENSDQYGNSGFQVKLDGNKCTVKFDDECIWFTVSLLNEKFIIEAFDGIHLSDVIRLVEDNAGTYVLTKPSQNKRSVLFSTQKREVVLKDGARHLGKCKASDNIDYYDRVWFSAEKKKPNKEDEVLVEVLSGDMFWCYFNGKNFVSSGSEYVQSDQIVDAYNWAWTYE